MYAHTHETRSHRSLFGESGGDGRCSPNMISPYQMKFCIRVPQQLHHPDTCPCASSRGRGTLGHTCPCNHSRSRHTRLLGCTVHGCSAAQLLGCSAALLHDCSAALLLGCSAHEYSAAQLMAARLHDRVPATRHSKKVSGVLGKGQYACWDREVVDLTIFLKGGATGGETMCVS